MIFLLVGAAFLLFVGLYWYLTWNFNYWKKRCVNGPEPLIFFGSFKDSLTGKCNLAEDLNQIYSTYKSREKFVGIFLTRLPQLFILDPKLANEVLVSNFRSFRDNVSSQWTHPKVEQLRPCSPFVATGSTWKEKRSELVAGLTVGRLKALYPSVQMICSKMTTALKAQIGSDGQVKEVDIKDLSHKFTAETVSDFIWGIAINAFGGPDRIPEIAKKMIDQSFKCVGFFLFAGIFPILRKFYSVRFFPEESETFFTQLLKDAIDLRKKSLVERSDLLAHLLSLQQKKGISISEMAGHTTTVVIDGVETGASVIAHCLLLLARNKNAQEKLRTEILDNLDADGTLSFEKLNDLPYLDQCVYETLRIFPPLAVLSKVCTEPFQLETSTKQKVQLSPGDIVHISSYSFHFDEEYFPNPQEFIPERFDDQNGGIRKFRDMGVFLPFGDGPRMCLGMKFGLFETKAAIVELVRNFEISLNPKTRADNKISAASFLLCLDGAIFLDFTIRSQ